MNYNISFEERAKLGMEILSKQSPVTLEKARAQAQWLNQASQSKNKLQTMKKEDLKYTTKLEVLLLIKQNNIPEAVAIVMTALKCGLKEAKVIVDDLRNEIK